jgi:hypothetical protein
MYCMPITEFWYQLTPIKVYWKGPTKTNQGRDHSQWKKYIFLSGPLSPTAEDTCKRKYRVAHFKWIKPKSNKLMKQRKHKRKLINNQDPISSWKPGITTKKCIPHPRLDPRSPTFNSHKVLFSTSQHLWTYNYLYIVDISRLSWFQKDSTQTHIWWQSDDIILNDRFMELPCFLGMNLSALDYKMDNFMGFSFWSSYISLVVSDDFVHSLLLQVCKIWILSNGPDIWSLCLVIGQTLTNQIMQYIRCTYKNHHPLLLWE